MTTANAPVPPTAQAPRFVDLDLPEFDAPPPDPVALFRRWFAAAAEHGVREPGAAALATVDVEGRCSNRMVQTIEVTDAGLLFTSHTGSGKGRDIDANGLASAVLYWRETRQQVILTGTAEQLSADASDALWKARPPGTHPMSVASEQSAPLKSEEALRDAARRLEFSGAELPRPATWAGYQLVPSSVEFWLAATDRLHRRLRYERTGDGWTSGRLQP